MDSISSTIRSTSPSPSGRRKRRAAAPPPVIDIPFLGGSEEDPSFIHLSTGSPMVTGNGATNMSPNPNTTTTVQSETGNVFLESGTTTILDSTTTTTTTTSSSNNNAGVSVGLATNKIVIGSGSTAVPSLPERQALKHLSASAPAIRTAVMRNGSSEPPTEFVLAPSSSKSRQKKFHRHFTTVPLEETVLDYYSCALVGDILLQGYLYITENHFAFYSNVFGYVTKLLIPVSSVVRITKERTAKIIPNAVGICTRSEKHVFASLLSRDTTHKLMCNVWQYSIQLEADEVTRVNNELKRVEQISTEVSALDESSGESGSGNDSAIEPRSYTPSPLNSPGVEKVVLVAKNSAVATALTASQSSNDDNEIQASSSIVGLRSGVNLPTVQGVATVTTTTGYRAHRLSVGQTAAVPNLTTFTNEGRKRNKTFSTMGIGQAPSLLALATAILVILFISAAVLLSRISILHQKVSERPVVHDSEQFYQELLAWQNKLHSSSADEIHQYINLNLQQIVRVRQSLEALSLLFMTNQPDGSTAAILKESANRQEAMPQTT